MLKTMQITVPQPLLEEVDEFLAGTKMTRSGFARRAFEEELTRMRVAVQERQHAEAYGRMSESQDEGEERALWESAQVWGDPWPNP